jgi:hypothetical protein
MAKDIVIAGVLLLGAVGVAMLAPSEPRAATTTATSVAPMAAFAHEVGSRQVVGYYMAEAGGCAVTMMLADPGSEEAPASSAARLKLTLQPAATAALDAPEGGRLAVTCGSGAKTMIVDSQPAAGRLASR